jgi:tetratricopeptide (TPR) repeat protein
VKTESGENLKPKSQYTDEAVQLAIGGKWEEAVELNRFIIEKFGADEESHNRLGKALTELGQLDEAKSSYESALQLNPLNPIARKNAAKLETLLQTKDSVRGGLAKVDLNLFVEEMGKTVVTSLEDVGDADICSKVVAGDLAELRVEGDGITAETVRGVRLGSVEPKLARRLIKFMQTGNRYQAGITSCEDSSVRLIIRETYQDPRNAGKPSFPMRRKREVEFRPYAKESLIPRDIDAFDEEVEDGEEPEEAAELEGLHAVDDEAEPIEDFGEDEDVGGDGGDDDDEE